MDHSHASVSKNKHQAFKMENVQITANKLLEKKKIFSKKFFFNFAFFFLSLSFFIVILLLSWE